MSDPSAWVDRALCTEVGDPVLWFAKKGRNDQVLEAKAVCGRCDVRADCLQMAMDGHLTTGVFGGLAPEERRLLRVATRR